MYEQECSLKLAALREAAGTGLKRSGLDWDIRYEPRLTGVHLRPEALAFGAGPRQILRFEEFVVGRMRSDFGLQCSLLGLRKLWGGLSPITRRHSGEGGMCMGWCTFLEPTSAMCACVHVCVLPG